jgi:hypothetical protein
MSDLIVIQPQVTTLTVTEDLNQVVVSSVGVQGPAGATGATGATGPSGVIAVTAPITNSGTSTSATIGVDAGSTSTAGVLQLTDSTSSTSTTTAATPNAVKSAYDLASVGINILKFLSGQYYRSPIVAASADRTVTNNTTTYTPIYIPESTTFDRIAMQTRATFVGTSTVRLGIYNNTNGQPSTLILDAGTVTATAATTVYEITISQTLAAGFYWLAFCQQTAPATSSYAGFGGANNVAVAIVGFGATAPSGNVLCAFTQGSVTGAFANAGTLSNSGQAIYTWLRTS